MREKVAERKGRGQEEQKDREEKVCRKRRESFMWERQQDLRWVMVCVASGGGKGGRQRNGEIKKWEGGKGDEKR